MSAGRNLDMERWFELWDARNASLVGTYETEEAALAVVQRSFASHGEESIRTLVLTAEEDGRDEPETIASGADLVALASRRALPIATRP